MKHLFLRTLAVGMAALLIGGAGTAMADVRLKLGHVGPPTHPFQTGALKLAELAHEYSKGEITIDVFPASQIGNERDLVEGARMGTVDMLLTSTGPVMGFDARFGVLDIPYIFRDAKHAHRVLDGEVGDELFKSLEAKGLKGLAWFENGFRDTINSKRPINSPADMEGLKIRSIENPIHVAYFKKLGANPLPMAWGELYPALEKKVVDGADSPIGAIVTARLYEVQKYLSMTSHIYSGVPVLMSMRKYKSLSPEHRAVLVKAAREAATFERDLLAQQDEEGIAALQKNGMEIVKPDLEPFMAVGRAVQQEFADKTDPGLLKKILASQ